MSENAYLLSLELYFHLLLSILNYKSFKRYLVPHILIQFTVSLSVLYQTPATKATIYYYSKHYICPIYAIKRLTILINNNQGQKRNRTYIRLRDNNEFGFAGTANAESTATATIG